MIQKFDELNIIPKYSEKKISRRKIPINEYFENMNISSEQKEKRIRLANLLLADVLFLFALSKRNSDKEYLSKSLQNRYTDSVKSIVQLDKKMQRYIRKVCDSIVNTTLSNNSDVAGDMESDGENISSENDYTTSIERATSIAENEANTILNNDEYRNAIKNGCTKKRWISFGDESVRTDHADVDGEVVDIDKPFHVGDCLMMYPRDDSLGAGLEEIVNCRCSVEYLRDAGGKAEDYLKHADEAVEYYEKIRKRNDDIDIISKNTGFSYDDIFAVKNHVFINNHILDTGENRFYPSYDMAIAWQRLINGEYEERDILLLNHARVKFYSDN